MQLFWWRLPLKCPVLLAPGAWPAMGMFWVCRVQPEAHSNYLVVDREYYRVDCSQITGGCFSDMTTHACVSCWIGGRFLARSLMGALAS